MINDVTLARLAGLIAACAVALLTVRAPDSSSRPWFWVAVAGLAVAVGAGFFS